MTHTSQELATFCKKKGFIYPSSEIYGGVAGLYDYGHLGTKLKHNFQNTWRKFFLSLHPNFYEIETANIMHAGVFKASGHLENFVDPVINCSKCDFTTRADHFVEEALGKRVEELSQEELTKEITKNNLSCPKCQSPFKSVEVLNMMFPIKMGVGTTNTAYLRPETAQSPYVNFKLQFELQRKKLPLGLALIGRAYRNEISPRNLTLRQREFTQAELQIFFNPNNITKHKHFDLIKETPLNLVLVENRDQGIQPITAQQLVDQGIPQFYVYHLSIIQGFYLNTLKIPKEKFRLYQLNDKEKAFYNKYHFDLEIELNEHGWTEVGGVHYRTDHDLKGHQEVSKEKMEIFDEASQSKFIPHVLELSFGVDRNVYALLDLNYENSEERGNAILHLPANLSPFTCAVFPLVKNKPEVVAKAEIVLKTIQNEFPTLYDEASSVGRRYARADEIGINYCITIDFESLEDNAVTVRDRDTTKQTRVKIDHLLDHLKTLK